MERIKRNIRILWITWGGWLKIAAGIVLGVFLLNAWFQSGEDAYNTKYKAVYKLALEANHGDETAAEQDTQDTLSNLGIYDPSHSESDND
jgi:hypothetical protein